MSRLRKLLKIKPRKLLSSQEKALKRGPKVYKRTELLDLRDTEPKQPTQEKPVETELSEQELENLHIEQEPASFNFDWRKYWDPIDKGLDYILDLLSFTSHPSSRGGQIVSRITEKTKQTGSIMRTKAREFTLPDKEPTITSNISERVHPKLRPVTKHVDTVMNQIQKQKEANPIMLWIWRGMKALIILGFVVLGLFFIWVATLEIPTLGNFEERQVRESTKIYDKTGEFLLYDVFEEERRTVIPLSEVSPNIQKAILAIEDDEFYNHHGVRPLAVIRSIIQKIQNPDSRLAGGSTITQQVIKNAILSSDRRIERKAKEWVLAWRLENQLSKEEILETYLNEIAFGGAVYGVEQAALSFFGKRASEVTIAEAAYLAAVPKAPTFYSPYGQNRDQLETRKDVIITRMRNLGYISQEEYLAALDEEVEFQTREDTGINAPHFVFYVIEYLEAQYGTEVVERGGLRVITTLDWELQQKLEEETAEYAEILPQYNAENLATVAIEAESGKIIGMVGSKGYFDEEIDGKFNIATAFRQPGSAFKPFVYAQAFVEGYTPQTVLWDVKTEFSTSCYPDGTPLLPQYADRCYSPNNYDSSTRGPISMEAALAGSLNIPAVKAIYLVGVSDAIATAKRLGITGLNRSPSFYGLALVLGGGEVRLLDMVSAYGTFANDGVRNKPVAIQEVKDREGEILEQYEQQEERAIDANVARMISEILSDDDLKRPIFGASNSLYHSDAQVAVKTGTTNDFKDTWTVGYTPRVAVGVWIGNNDNTPMARRPSSTVAAPYWRRVMDATRSLYPAQERFGVPAYPDPSTLPPVLQGVWQGGDQELLVDTRTGTLATSDTPEEFIETQYVANYHSILHWVDKSNPRGGGNSTQDGLYEHWEYPIAAWAAATGLQTSEEQLLGLGATTSTSTDFEDDEDESDVTLPVDFSIVEPASDALIDANERQEIRIQITGPAQDIDRIFYYVNDTYLGSGGHNETSTSFVPSSVRTIANTNIVRVVVQTDDDRRIEREAIFKIK